MESLCSIFQEWVGFFVCLFDLIDKSSDRFVFRIYCITFENINCLFFAETGKVSVESDLYNNVNYNIYKLINKCFVFRWQWHSDSKWVTTDSMLVLLTSMVAAVFVSHIYYLFDASHIYYLFEIFLCSCKEKQERVPECNFSANTERCGTPPPGVRWKVSLCWNSSSFHSPVTTSGDQ